jgi:hypothetical protein
MPETSRTTEADIIQADAERATQAAQLAFMELREAYDKVVDWKSLLRWRRAVNKRAAEIFKRVN